MSSRFKLGPIQKAWIADLRAHPELQITGQLGQRDENRSIVGLCCLGQYEITYCRIIGKEPQWNKEDNGDALMCNGSRTILSESWKEMGLRSTSGRFAEPCEGIVGLAGLNDGGKTWLEIADYVEAHPENVFTKSI